MFRSLVSLSAILLFQTNVGYVSAEEPTGDLQSSTQEETVVESFEESDDELVERNSEHTQGELNDDSEEDLADESIEDDINDQETDNEKDSVDEDAEIDSKDNFEDEAEDLVDTDGTSETEELQPEEDTSDLNNQDVVNSDENKTTEDETEETEEERVDTDASEEVDAEEDIEEATEDAEETEDVEDEQPEEMTAAAQRNTSTDVEVDRIAGQNRYKNAVELSKSGWNSASTVILTNGEKFADSLTGSPLASLHNAPILLTRADRLPSETLAEIRRLNPNQVIALGGELSVSNAVLDTLNRNGFSTRRIGGRTRYLLAENIAKEVMAEEGLNRDAFLVSGEVYSDAMSIAPVAASKRLPIFLTRGNVLHQTVINAIPHVNSWTIIGGHLTISPEVEARMNNLGARTRRMDGRSRYDVNQTIINHYGSSSDHMYVASGEHFSDATPASVLAARNNSSVLLVKDNNKATLKEQRDFANRHNISHLTLIGGPLTLSKATEDYFNNQNYLIYLDPGHGGAESGAVGWVDGRQYIEKNLNLQVSLKVRNLLEDKGYKVAMSRTNDTFVNLFRRPEEANNLGADIFVSLHHNAMPNSSTTTGIETFYYAPSSNYPPLDKNRPYHNDPDRIAGSKRLAELIHGELIDHTGAYDRGVKRGAYVVVREARMPAVLLEYGFMSTPSDLRVFTQNWYQNRLAQATVDGIERYFL